MKNFMKVLRKSNGFILPMTIITMGIISIALISILGNVNNINEYFNNEELYSLKYKDIDRKISYVMSIFNKSVINNYEGIKSKGIKGYYNNKQNEKLAEFENCYIKYIGYECFSIMDNNAYNHGLRAKFIINISDDIPKYEFTFVENK